MLLIFRNYGIFPTSLKIVKVMPLLKKGSPEILSTYRPISFILVLDKISETFLINAITILKFVVLQ